MLALGAAIAASTLPGWSRAQATAKPLITRPIPKTKEPLPVIGLGTAIIFDIGDDSAQRAERAKVINTFLAGGARLIDTAPSYGSAESVVGDLLALAEGDAVAPSLTSTMPAKVTPVTDVEVMPMRAGYWPVRILERVGEQRGLAE